MAKILKKKKEKTDENLDKYTLLEKPVEEVNYVPEVYQESVAFWKAGKGFIWSLVIIIFLLVAFISGGLIFKNLYVPLPSPIVLLETPTPVPSFEIDLTKYKIKVLNGSGVLGAAAKMQAVLQSAGFVVSSVGNADNANYSDTQILAASSVDVNYLARLKDDLGANYSLKADVANNTDSSVDVVVIVGSFVK